LWQLLGFDVELMPEQAWIICFLLSILCLFFLWLWGWTLDKCCDSILWSFPSCMACSFLLKFYCGNSGFRFVHFLFLDPEGKSDEDDLSPKKTSHVDTYVEFLSEFCFYVNWRQTF
jgi:hypothetical protein